MWHMEVPFCFGVTSFFGWYDSKVKVTGELCLKIISELTQKLFDLGKSQKSSWYSKALVQMLDHCVKGDQIVIN